MNRGRPAEGWHLIDREMLLAAADPSLLSERTLRQLEVYGHSHTLSFINEAMLGSLSPLTAVGNLSKVLHLLAKRGSMVFLGGGACILTRHIPSGLHVRLDAPLEWRIDNHARRWSKSRREARRHVLARSRDREAFVRTFLGQDIADPAHYHLVFDNQEVSADEASAEVVRRLVDWRRTRSFATRH
jgi:hypothetical protein